MTEGANPESKGGVGVGTIPIVFVHGASPVAGVHPNISSTNRGARVSEYLQRPQRHVAHLPAVR
jgi:hypothetical protein